MLNPAPIECRCRHPQEYSQGFLEVHTNAEGEEVTVNQRVEVPAEEVGIGQAGGVGVLVDSIQPDTDRLGTLVEQTVGAVAVDVVGERDARRQVYTGEDVVLLSQCACTVAPGIGGDEAIPTVDIACSGIDSTFR